jgi:hypothetical protein
MGGPKGKAGGYQFGQGPPGKIFLGIGAGLLLLNHLSVVLGNGIVLEALVLGSWCSLMGGWVQFARRSFDAVWGWAKPSARRELGLGVLTIIIAAALAEAVAWFAYGQHLWN